MTDDNYNPLEPMTHIIKSEEPWPSLVIEFKALPEAPGFQEMAVTELDWFDNSPGRDHPAVAHGCPRVSDRGRPRRSPVPLTPSPAGDGVTDTLERLRRRLEHEERQRARGKEKPPGRLKPAGTSTAGAYQTGRP
jgi:hypothetical protein